MYPSPIFELALQCVKEHVNGEFTLLLGTQIVSSKTALDGALVIKEPYEGVWRCKLHVWYMRKLEALAAQ